MNTFDFELFVIGAGSGGVRAARMAAATGARVAVAESGALGGTCVNVGCIPKKLYRYAAHYAEAFEQAKGYGWQVDAHPALDWRALKANRARDHAAQWRVWPLARWLRREAVSPVRAVNTSKAQVAMRARINSGQTAAAG